MTIDKYFNAVVYFYYIGKEYFPFLRTYDIIKNPEEQIFIPIDNVIKNSVKQWKKKTKIWILSNLILNETFRKQISYDVKYHSKMLTSNADLIVTNFEELNSWKSTKKSIASKWNPYKFNEVNSWSASEKDCQSQDFNRENFEKLQSYKELKTSSLIKYLKMLLNQLREKSLKNRNEAIKLIQRPYQDLLDNSELSVETLNSVYYDEINCNPIFKYVKDIKENYDFYKSKVWPILSEWIYVGALESDHKLQESLQKLKNTDEEDLWTICNINWNEDDNLLVYCEICNLPFHQKWFGVRVVPKGNWEWYAWKAFGKKYIKNVECFLCPVKGKSGLVPTNIINDKKIDKEKLLNNWAEIESSNERNKYFSKIKLRKTTNQIVLEESENVAKLKDQFKTSIYRWAHATWGQLIPEWKKSANMPLGLAEMDINRFLTKWDICDTDNGATVNCSSGNH